MRRVILIIACLFMTAALSGQEESDQRFLKITHSGDRTVAVDSAGMEWIYDVEEGAFVPESEYRKKAGRARDRMDEDDFGKDDVILPPEIRCTKIYDRDITEIFDEVVVDIDERVEGSVTSGRDVIVRGLVTGSVISYRSVYIESTGEVRGDVIARTITRERGGRILGQRIEVPFPEAIGIGVPSFTGIFPFFGEIVFTGFLIFICVITIALFPRHLNLVVAKIEGGIVKTFFWGLLGLFSVLPIFVLLVITIVGIPVAILIYPFVFLAGLILGYVAATVYIGRRLAPILNWPGKSIYLLGILGVIAIAALRILAHLFASMGASGLGSFIAAIYTIVLIVAITVGFGAVLSSRFGTRPKPLTVPAAEGPLPQAPRPKPPVPPVTPPPPPRSDSDSPRPGTAQPPPPKPPPVSRGDDATDEGQKPSNK